jgi:hypothetical protein
MDFVSILFVESLASANSSNLGPYFAKLCAFSPFLLKSQNGSLMSRPTLSRSPQSSISRSSSFSSGKSLTVRIDSISENSSAKCLTSDGRHTRSGRPHRPQATFQSSGMRLIFRSSSSCPACEFSVGISLRRAGERFLEVLSGESSVKRVGVFCGPRSWRTAEADRLVPLSLKVRFTGSCIPSRCPLLFRLTSERIARSSWASWMICSPWGVRKSQRHRPQSWPALGPYATSNKAVRLL